MIPPDDPVLHVGDRLRFVCPREPELCVDRSVGADGTVDLPLVGPLPAATHHASEVARDVLSRLFGDLRPPELSVRWLGPKMDEVTVQGAVRHSLSLYAPHGVARDRLLDAAVVALGGDLTLLGPSRLQKPGSTLTVEAIASDRRISLLGAVARPLSLPPSNALILSAAVEAAGGLTGHADANAITILRRGEPIPVALPADAGFLLQPGDVVTVAFIADRHYIGVSGLVVHPGTVEYAPGMTATRALSAAGGVLPGAEGATLVWRSGDKTFRLSLAFLFARRIPDPVLGPMDSISVETKAP